jgi:hypothetical protein
MHCLFTTHLLLCVYSLSTRISPLPRHCLIPASSLSRHCLISSHCVFTATCWELDGDYLCTPQHYPLRMQYLGALHHARSTFLSFDQSPQHHLAVHCLFPASCLCTAYSLPIHCLFTAYSLPIHCLFTSRYCLITALITSPLPTAYVCMCGMLDVPDFARSISLSHWLNTAYALPMHCLCTGYLLCPACSLYIHCLLPHQCLVAVSSSSLSTAYQHATRTTKRF